MNQRLQRIIHRGSLLIAIAFLIFIPIGMTIEGNGWGRLPEGFELAFFFYAWIFAIINYRTRTGQKTTPQ